MQGKTEEGKPLDVFIFLDGRAPQFYYNRFIRDNMSTEEGREFNVVKTAFIEELREEEKAHEGKKKAMVGMLDSTILNGSLSAMDSLFSKAIFNNE